jgi:hypothetical protein
MRSYTKLCGTNTYGKHMGYEVNNQGKNIALIVELLILRELLSDPTILEIISGKKKKEEEEERKKERFEIKESTRDVMSLNITKAELKKNLPQVQQWRIVSFLM